MKLYIYFLIALAVIFIDQAFKLWVYFDHLTWPMCGYNCYEIDVLGNWFKLHYLLNPGMAFGIKWNSEFGKLALTVFRIVAMAGISYYLVQMWKKKAHHGFLVCLSLILGGAIGNVVDSTFYGVFLDNAPENSPTKWFHGQVIDMLYFPLFNFDWPQWVPFLGGRNFEFFSPVFNLADSSIFIGVVIILLFQKRYFKETLEGNEEETQAADTVAPSAEEIHPPKEDMSTSGSVH